VNDLPYIPIRPLFAVRNDDFSLVSVLKDMQDRKFISLSARRLVECNKCRAKTPLVDGDLEKSAVCRGCGKKVSSTKPLTERYIGSINYDKIADRITQLIGQSEMAYAYDPATTSWRVQHDGKWIPVIIAGLSSSDLVLSCSEGSGSLIILLDRPKYQSLINSMNGGQFIDFHDLFDDSKALLEGLKRVSTTFNQSYSVKLEAEFDAMLKEMDYNKFEAFCVRLLDAVKERQEKLTSYYVYLGSKKDTLINAKVVKMGGPGKYDFFVINLLDYLQSALKPDKFGESKRYSNKTRFTITDFGLGLVHADSKPSLFIVSTNDVQHEVWDKVIGSKVGKDHKYVVLDKNLILLILFRLNLENLISDFTKKPPSI
jgi:hypothetical protein